jgi:hypothetical protein
MADDSARRDSNSGSSFLLVTWQSLRNSCLYISPNCKKQHLGGHGQDSDVCDDCQRDFAQAVGMST